VWRSEATVVASTIAVIVESTLKVSSRTCHRCDFVDEGDTCEGKVVAQNRLMDFGCACPERHVTMKASLRASCCNRGRCGGAYVQTGSQYFLTSPSFRRAHKLPGPEVAIVADDDGIPVVKVKPLRVISSPVIDQQI
jgi:hypothetical protein